MIDTMEDIMSDKKQQENITRRNFLKKMAMPAVFVAPTINTFSLLQQKGPWYWWTGHHHHHGHGTTRPTPPPPPSGF